MLRMENFTPQIWKRIKSLWGKTSSVISGKTQNPTCADESQDQEADTPVESDSLQEKLDTVNVQKIEQINECVLQLADEKTSYQYEIADLQQAYSDYQMETAILLETYEHHVSQLQEQILQLSETEDKEKERLVKLCEEQALTMEKMNENYKQLHTLSIDGLNRISEILLHAEKNVDDVNGDGKMTILTRRIRRWKDTIQKKIRHCSTKHHQSVKSCTFESKEIFKKPLHRNLKASWKCNVPVRARSRWIEEDDDCGESDLKDILKSFPESNGTFSLSTSCNRKRKFINSPLYSPPPQKQYRKNQRESTMYTRKSVSRQVKSRSYPKLPPLQKTNRRSNITTATISTVSRKLTWLDEIDEVLPEESVSQVAIRNRNNFLSMKTVNDVKSLNRVQKSLSKSKCNRNTEKTTSTSGKSKNKQWKKKLASETSESAITINELFRILNLDSKTIGY